MKKGWNNPVFLSPRAIHQFFANSFNYSTNQSIAHKEGSLFVSLSLGVVDRKHIQLFKFNRDEPAQSVIHWVFYNVLEPGWSSAPLAGDDGS